MKLKTRPLYLDKLLAAKDNGLIKVITGMRRCGKSSLLKLLGQRLVSAGVPSDHILTINLESFEFASFDRMQLHDHIAGLMQDDDRYYLLLDEVQLIDGWERVVNALQVDANVDIYLTGSNAHLPSRQLGTLLSGRYVEIRVFPLSFAEFLRYTGELDRNTAFERYMRYGGLPPVVDQGTNQELAYTVLSGIYDTVLVRDISQYLQIRNPMVFNDVARYLADTAGSPVSISRIEHRLKSARRSATNDTIERYISGLLDAFLFHQARRINVKDGDHLQGLSKYYPADPGIRNTLVSYHQGDIGPLLELIVHNELKTRGYDVQVGRMDNLEIDFVADRISADMTDERLFIQVSATIMDASTRDREFEPLRRLHNASGRRMILTLDTFGLGSVDGIDVVNALDWLTHSE
ncbi:ATP-binding protein [Bifidobacterium callitrichos]|uniref:ATPase n=1 Tax=Bifidobacterium callitrichos DSM 23973 TaxID=1437609 RepID=A0A086ZY24_9BIFI|nr:ATP-binding protein [Bifidobacterium callitrichos]KFI51424.1 ATPase [Bifidobacterium callitrichos DSM 23973]